MGTKNRQIASSFETRSDGEVRLRTSKDAASPVEVVVGTATLADSNEGSIDTFDGTSIRSALYTISANTAGDSEHQAQQIYVTHDGDTATLTTYGTLLHSASTIVMYDADIDSSDTVSIKADPQISQGLNFSFKRIDTPKPT
tara:strand:+ start:648 stop:1073 length:426 start_codon:yes stop_codon:yes gene_type:complete